MLNKSTLFGHRPQAHIARHLCGLVILQASCQLYHLACAHPAVVAGVSNDMLDFMLDFFEAHPDLVDNDLFITGESYAGHYVPAVTHRLWLWNKGSGNTPKFNLQGLAIGACAPNASAATCTAQAPQRRPLRSAAMAAHLRAEAHSCSCIVYLNRQRFANTTTVQMHVRICTA